MYARRYLRLRNALAVALAAVLVLVAIACGQSTGIIPWLNYHPAPVKAPPAAPPCRVADLSVHFDFGVSATDPSAARNHRVPSLNMNGFFIIANEGRHACSLAGRPQLKLIDPEVRKPRLLEKYSVPARPAPGSVDSLAPLSLLRAVPPHQRAELGFNWKNWCGPGPAPRAIELRLPGGGSIVRHFLLPKSNLGLTAPRCEQRRRQTELDYGPFHPLWRPKSVLGAYGMKSVLPLRVSVITKGLPAVRQKAIADFSGPGTTYVRGYEYSFPKVKRGAVFHFRVALRNTGTTPFRFARCPLYLETLNRWFITGGHEETYVLNCHPVGAIAPGKLAYFAMELHVPKDQPLGQNYLGWLLEDANRGNLGVVAVLVVP